MARASVIRPVVRAFDARFEREAAAHVRAGGHAVVWDSPKRGRLVFNKPKGRAVHDLGRWSLLDLGREVWGTVESGPLRGLAAAPVPRDCVGIVQARILRDSVHPGSTRRLELDCQECGSCCRDNRVELEKADIRRFQRAGRPELARYPYARRDGGKVVLRLLASRDCRHLARDKRCAIYEVRPDSCRDFPPGSEGCLFSREEELGIIDGASS